MKLKEFIISGIVFGIASIISTLSFGSKLENLNILGVLLMGFLWIIITLIVYYIGSAILNKGAEVEPENWDMRTFIILGIVIIVLNTLRWHSLPASDDYEVEEFDPPGYWRK